MGQIGRLNRFEYVHDQKRNIVSIPTAGMNGRFDNVIKISTDDIPEPRRLAMFCEIYGRTILKHDIEPAGDRPFVFKGMLWRLPGLGVATATIGPCRAPRESRHIDNDDLVFNISVSGGRLVHQRNREALVGAGEAVLTTAADPGVVTIPAQSRLISLRIPRAAMSARALDLDTYLVRSIPRNTGPLMLLSGYLREIRRPGILTQPEPCDAVVRHIYDLVSLALGAGGDARQAAEMHGVRAARRSAVLCLIEDRSDDPELSAITAAAALGVTPRYVHSLLEETGRSFTSHVTEKRLDNAAAILRDTAEPNFRIADVALAAGFNDLSYFNRSFRRRYGATPSEMRENARRAPTAGPLRGKGDLS
jgi:AraC-like DNA-binding protein